MRSEIKTSHQVVGTWWDDTTSRWNLKVKDLVTEEIAEDYCDFLLNATGILKYAPISIFDMTIHFTESH